MTQKPLVSVIIPFLDAGNFIQEAIDSVLAQTCPDWELFLVDDGSTDGSTAVALRYMREYPRKIRYLQHPDHENRGMSASRNLGIRQSDGEFVAFLDADDIWLPEKLAEEIEVLRAYPEAAMMYGRTLRWYSWTGKLKDLELDYMDNPGIETDTLVEPPQLVTGFLEDEETVASTCSVLIRRKTFERLGGFEETFHDLYEDMVFYTKVFLKEPVAVSSGCRGWYRQHRKNSGFGAIETGQWHPARPNPARQRFLNWLARYISEQGVENDQLWRALQTELWPYHHRIISTPLVVWRYMKWRMQGVAKLRGRVMRPTTRRWQRALRQDGQASPPVAWERFCSLRRMTPVSRIYGCDRGLPIDRYYIERFLAQHSEDIRGRVLEIKDDLYTCKFGGKRVNRSEVLHVADGNPKATIVADLTRAEKVPSNSFDCEIVTQTLQLIYDVRAAIKTLYRTLKPGGVLLATVPSVSQIGHQDWGDDCQEADCWCWSFTAPLIQRLVEEAFPAPNVEVSTYGNALVAGSFLDGLAMEELEQEELDDRDPDHPMLITVSATKPSTIP